MNATGVAMNDEQRRIVDALAPVRTSSPLKVIVVSFTIFVFVPLVLVELARLPITGSLLAVCFGVWFLTVVFFLYVDYRAIKDRQAIIEKMTMTEQSPPNPPAERKPPEALDELPAELPSKVLKKWPYTDK